MNKFECVRRWKGQGFLYSEIQVEQAETCPAGWASQHRWGGAGAGAMNSRRIWDQDPVYGTPPSEQTDTSQEFSDLKGHECVLSAIYRLFMVH